MGTGPWGNEMTRHPPIQKWTLVSASGKPWRAVCGTSQTKEVARNG